MLVRGDLLILAAGGNPRRDSNCRGPVGDIAQHKRHRADLAVVSYAYITKDLGICPEFNVVTDHGDPVIIIAVTDGDSLPQGAMGADHDFGMDEDVAEMPDTQSGTDTR